jgi:hypothetical protein
MSFPLALLLNEVVRWRGSDETPEKVVSAGVGWWRRGRAVAGRAPGGPMGVRGGAEGQEGR